MNIAICNDIKEFRGNRLAEREWGSRFPGTGWATFLFENGPLLGIEVASGDVALDHVKSGRWKAPDTHVIQELDARDGLALCRRGARPALLTLFESPIVAFRSMDRLRRMDIGFEHCMGPAPLLETMPAQRAARWFRMAFPSFWSLALAPQPDRAPRRQLALVAAQKHVREVPRGARRGLFRRVKRCVRRSLSPTFRAFGCGQLHDERLALVFELAARNAVDVYGRGWDQPDMLPPEWACRAKHHRAAFKGPCIDKLGVLRGYRSALVFENTACAGYVTEKVVDAMAARCVPVYRGAPDVTDHVPGAALIQLEPREPPAAIADRILGISESSRHAIVAAGAEYLRSPAGVMHTHEGFAHWVVNTLKGRLTSC